MTPGYEGAYGGAAAIDYLFEFYLESIVYSYSTEYSED